MADQLVEMKLSDLILDFDLYPRPVVDRTNVASIVHALEAGNRLPAIVADAESKRVVDGFHRCRAYERVLGPDALVPVLLRDYASEAAMFTDAIELNAAQGKRLTSYDVAFAATRAAELGLSRQEVATALHLTRDRLEELTRDRGARSATGEDVLVKRSIRHMAGSTMTAEQVLVNERLSGWKPQFHARQLIDILEHNLLDPADEDCLQALRHLRDLLAKVVSGMGLGPARWGVVSCGKATWGEARIRPGGVWRGAVGLGRAGLGTAGRGEDAVRSGDAWWGQVWRVMVTLGKARRGCGRAGFGAVWSGAAAHVPARHGRAR